CARMTTAATMSYYGLDSW
nr:immunoglobulin heavy chain junction region [Macaca mulatta]MOX38387.1 immunoglobulin heavy chain junction region [Macaca mulatta]MOX38574.1 immunoglobulin heavy chain junction region [Macaca mulatta]MOX39086.1 immunoglobulin heavy chain junction region [Macaca mulatta]MOX39466.1 immunoglobulin heavy chain junction region [Macaca mulatta]